MASAASPFERDLHLAIWAYGDPHGEWRPLMLATADGRIVRGDTVILMGDYETYEPLRRILEPVRATGATVRWLLGNHDVLDDAAFASVASWSEAHLGGRVHVAADGMRIAGLSGVFKGRFWYPRTAPDEPPRWPSRAAYIESLRPCQRWRGGLPLRDRDAIWPEDVELLAVQRADVLVCHEAPTTHEHGFAAIDGLARRMGARLVVHGHHHRSYDAVTPDYRVRCLGIAELWRLPDTLKGDQA